MEQGDLELIDRTLAGEATAFEKLVLRYQDRLFNALVRTLGCAEEAKDVVQDTFLLAFRKLNTFQRESAFFTWLFRIGFNTAISYKRKRRPELSVDTRHEETGEEPMDRGEGPSTNMEREEQIAKVRQALEMVNEQYRAILVLREMEGFCYESIAEILDLPVGTVRSRLHRARAELKEKLELVMEGNPIE